METIIFTEIVNCGPVGRIMLESFHKYHDIEITIYATATDIQDLGEIKFHHNNSFITISAEVVEKFNHGHIGTAHVFADMFYPGIDKRVIQIDSDVVFKKESISLIENAFDEGYDIVGSRRCYKNNPGKVPVLDGIPDAVSTYFFGMKTKVLPKQYSFDEMCKMWEGHPIGIDHMILDFADPIYYHCLKNGAKTKFLESDLIGGQNSEGSKVNKYKSNLHLDMGSHLAHFGGCGSGYSVAHGISSPEKSYAEWSMGRWTLFSKLFYNKDIAFPHPAIYGPDNRWVSGGYDDHILNLIKEDLEG